MVSDLLLFWLFPPSVSCLVISYFYFRKHPSFRFKGKIFFKLLRWNVNEYCDVGVAIDRAGSKITTLEVFFSLHLPSGIYGTLLLELMLLTTIAKKKTLFAWNCRLH